MSKYMVAVLRDGNTERTCGHEHRTAQAASGCLRALRGDARFYGATILKDGQRADGIGRWADGECKP